VTEWRAVLGFPGYEVSDDGQVRSVDRVVVQEGRWGGTIRRRLTGGPLRPAIAKRGGYPIVKFRKDGRQVTRSVHSLVAETFIGPRPPGQEVLHGDGVPTHVSRTNLSYGTRSDNVRDAVRHGSHFQARKNSCPRSHILKAPNLVTSKLPRRQCLACDRAKRSALYHGHDEEWMRRDADRRYKEIMGGVA
jgi:hypothetical protein